MVLNAAPAAAAPRIAEPPSSKAKQAPALRDAYQRLYTRVRHRGLEPGRNIVKHGVNARPDRPAGNAEVARSVRTFRRWLNPPPVAVPAQPAAESSSAAPAPSSSGGGAGGDLASIRACESGGNYRTNTGNGFSGAYQFDQSTWKAAGGSTEHAYQAPPAEQDRVAARWIASGHRSAWPSC